MNDLKLQHLPVGHSLASLYRMRASGVHFTSDTLFYVVHVASLFVGFKAVEWGAEIPDQYSVQELVAAREKAGVSVIGLCTPAGTLFINNVDWGQGSNICVICAPVQCHNNFIIEVSRMDI